MRSRLTPALQGGRTARRRLVVSNFGSEMGAATCRQLRSDTGIVAALYALTCSNVYKQQSCCPERSVRDEEAAGSDPATPTQIKRPQPSGKWPFSCPYNSEVQQRLPAELPAQTLERLAGRGV